MTTADPYRRIASVYDRVVEPLQSGVREVALGVVPPQPDWHVLDVGCGTGTGLARYVEVGCAVTGVDVSPAMLDKAATRLGDRADLRLTDGGDLPFDRDRFDLVTTSMVLHEVPAAERVALLTEMARVTSLDGRMLLIDYRFGSLRGLRGRTLRAMSDVIERVSGHYEGYRSFRASGGIPALLGDAELDIEREKIVAGGIMGIYVIAPAA
jgi:ubiquinone/menaquinone biosynthesis C-methylase UbiE